MRVVPRTLPEILAFARAQRDKWQPVLSQIGLSEADLEQLTLLLDESEEKRDVANSLKSAALSATAARRDAVDRLVRQLSSMILSIRAEASKAGENESSVLTTAGIPSPEPGHRLPTPPKPSQVDVQITSSGTVELKWDVPSKNAYKGKTYYIIQRRMVGADGIALAWETIGQPARRSFTDLTIAPGFARAEYLLYATRNNKRSEPAQAFAIFGVVPGSLPKIVEQNAAA